MPAPIAGLLLAGLVFGAGTAIGSKLAKKLVIPKGREAWGEIRKNFNRWEDTGAAGARAVSAPRTSTATPEPGATPAGNVERREGQF